MFNVYDVSFFSGITLLVIQKYSLIRMYFDNVWQLLRSPFYLKIFHQRHILVEQCIRYMKSLMFCIFVKTVYPEKYFIKTVFRAENNVHRD